MIIEVVLLLVLAAGFLFGFFRGLVRQALALAAWALTFVGAAYLRVPLGDWLATTSSTYTFDYSLMLAFLALFLASFTGALLLVEFGGGGSSLTRHPLLDDAIGGVLGLFVAVLFLAGIVVIFDAYFVPHPAVELGEVGWLREVAHDLSASSVVGLLREWVIRPLGIVLGPLLPSDIRVVMG